MITFDLYDPAFVASLAGSSVPAALPTTDPNLWAWYSSDTGLSNNGTLINVSSTAWTDRSGNARHMEVTTGNQPGYTASGPNGYPAITFGLANSKFIQHPSGVSGLSQPWSVFLLVKQISCFDNRYLMDGLANGASGALIQNTCSPCVRPVGYTGSGTLLNGPMTGGLRLNEWHIVTVIYNGSSTITQVDNAYEQSGSINSGNPGRLLFGNYSGGGSNGAQFQLAAAIIVTGAANSTQRNIHKNWLFEYGGLLKTAPNTGTPLDDPQLFSWWKSDTGLTNNGTIITAGNGVWADQSGLNVTTRAGQVLSTNEPAYLSSGPNGKPAVRFVAANSKIISHQIGETGLQQPYSIFALVRANSWTTNRWFWDGDSGTTGGLYQVGSTPNINAISPSAGPTGSLTLSAWKIVSVIYDGSQSILQIDNLATSVGDVGGSSPQRIKFGNWGGGGSNGAEYDLAGVIVTSGHPASAARTLHKNWLAAYGGLTI